MSKPNNKKCEKYCDLFPCSRTNCNRKLLSRDGGKWSMVDKHIYDYWRSKERYREWREDRNCKVNN